MMKKKLMSSLSVAALAAVLYMQMPTSRQKIFRNRISEDLQRPVPSRR